MRFYINTIILLFQFINMSLPSFRLFGLNVPPTSILQEFETEVFYVLVVSFYHFGPIVRKHLWQGNGIFWLCALTARLKYYSRKETLELP